MRITILEYDWCALAAVILSWPVSLSFSTGRQDFPRLRIGIGRPASESVSDYVLSKFASEEEATLRSVAFPAGVRAVQNWVAAEVRAAVDKAEAAQQRAGAVTPPTSGSQSSSSSTPAS